MSDIKAGKYYHMWREKKIQTKKCKGTTDQSYAVLGYFQARLAVFLRDDLLVDKVQTARRRKWSGGNGKNSRGVFGEE